MFISASSPDYSLPFKSVGRQNSNLVPELLLGSGFDGDTALLQIRSDSIGVPAPRSPTTSCSAGWHKHKYFAEYAVGAA